MKFLQDELVKSKMSLRQVRRRMARYLKYFGLFCALLTLGLLAVYFLILRQPNYQEPTPTADQNSIVPDGGMWLKGDFHIHSRHSKDSTINPVSRIIGFAEDNGFDILAITDHDNHVFGDVRKNTWADPEFRSESVLLFYGAEWTTHRGHANTFSVKPYDHAQFFAARDSRDQDLLELKSKLGIHVSANHPIGGDPYSFSYDFADSLEVWNSVQFTSGAIVWDDLLKSGRMLPGRGGSDSHHGFPGVGEKKSDRTFERRFNYVGTPTTWLYAKSRTLEGALDAMEAGHMSVSANPYSPRLEFAADTDDDGAFDMMMGDNQRASTKPVTFKVQLVGNGAKDRPYKVRVIKDGAEFQVLNTDPSTGGVEFTDTPRAEERTYYRVEVYGKKNQYPEVGYSSLIGGNMVGLSNPIYFNFNAKL